MGAPVRLRLSRQRGFDLQRLSWETNGLEAVNVARPTKWGNPFLVHPRQKPGRQWGIAYFSVPTVEDAIACYREMLTCDGAAADLLRNSMLELAGKNLACWCRPCDPCHADVLLEIANPLPSKE